MLTIREKELVSFGASVAAGCKPCTRYHVKKVREAGASDNEIEQAITDALRVRDHARDIMECQAMKLVGVDRHHEDEDAAPDVARMTGLVSIAILFQKAGKKVLLSTWHIRSIPIKIPRMSFA